MRHPASDPRAGRAGAQSTDAVQRIGVMMMTLTQDAHPQKNFCSEHR